MTGCGSPVTQANSHRHRLCGGRGPGRRRIGGGGGGGTPPPRVNQENLLNTYRCLFGVDTDVVPSGCPNPDQAPPGPAPANPTQHDIEVRDALIQSQEALLNVYRCRFDIDTHLVPGGCSQQPDDKPPTGGTDDTSSIAPPAESAAIGVLNGLTVEAEYEGSGYVRADFEHDRDYLCANAGTDPYTGINFNPSTCEVDYIVAAQEAFESGAWAWNAAQRMAFGNDAENLIATRDCVKQSKGAHGLAEWSGRIESGVCQGTETTVDGRCFLAQRMVQVKAAYSLSVDQDEKTALITALEACSGRSLPSTGTGSIIGTIEKPAPTDTPSTALSGGLSSTRGPASTGICKWRRSGCLGDLLAAGKQDDLPGTAYEAGPLDRICPQPLHPVNRGEADGSLPDYCTLTLRA